MIIDYLSKPIVSIVVSIFIVILGSVSLGLLPVELYPNMMPAMVSLNTTYQGADANAVEQSVAVPLEQQFTGTEKLSYMSSTSANDGSLTLNVTFDVDSNPDLDQIHMQLRANQGASQLPEEVRTAGIDIQKSSGLPLLIFALTSDNEAFDALFLANYARIGLNDAIVRVKGVSKVDVLGAGKYAMRIWMRPDALARHQLTVTDVIAAIKSQNRENPAGQLGGEPSPKGQQRTLTIHARGRLETEDDFRNLVIKADKDGSLIRLNDVAKVEIGADSYNITSRFDGKQTALLCIYQSPGSNALETARGVIRKMNNLSDGLPPGLSINLALDTTRAIEAGIDEIYHTMAEALALVVFVVYIFLQGWRAALIPLIAVPVSLMGTFILFPFIGYSVNTISLFGLVLAIGLVVDDPIVVVEAVEQNRKNFPTIAEAVKKTMTNVRGPIIATTLVLLAVFLPTLLIPGISGKLFGQFATTVCVAVIISAFNSLTLSPALAILLLRSPLSHNGCGGGLTNRFNEFFSILTARYVGVSRLLIEKSGYAIAILIVVLVLVIGIQYRIPTAFVPEEDQGFLTLSLQLPAGASLQRTSEVASNIDSRIREVPGVSSITSIIGSNLASGINSTYTAFYFVNLLPWSIRNESGLTASSIIKSLNKILIDIPDGTAFALSPPAIPGIGTSGGISMMIEDRGGHDFNYLNSNLDKFIKSSRKAPELAFVSTNLVSNAPQIQVDVDRDKSMKHGVDISDVFRTLQSFMGSELVNYFNIYGRQWPVIIEASPEYRNSITRVGQLYVKNKSGDMVPMDALTHYSETTGPEFVSRHNMYRGAQIYALPTGGYTSEQGMKALERVFHEVMPYDMGYDYTGMSYQEKRAASGPSLQSIITLSLVSIYLILAAQYESWSVPLAVIISTPFVIFGALVALMLSNNPMNIYCQIGLIILVGLAAKNAILIVENARILRRQGLSIEAAALVAAQNRFRPIIMTALTFIFGATPLILATGSGAQARSSMGMTILGGMLSATIFATLFIPVSYCLVEKLSDRIRCYLKLH